MLQTIFQRRSIRKFKDEPLLDEEIGLLLQCAMAAPSANNLKAWQFVAITQRERLNQLAEIHPYGKMLQQAPAALLICGDSLLQPNIGYLLLDCAAATQNVLLAATALKIGSVWLGVYPREQRMNDIKVLLNIPENVVPIALVALGYADEKKAANDPWMPEKIHYNNW